MASAHSPTTAGSENTPAMAPGKPPQDAATKQHRDDIHEIQDHEASPTKSVTVAAGPSKSLDSAVTPLASSPSRLNRASSLTQASKDGQPASPSPTRSMNLPLSLASAQASPPQTVNASPTSSSMAPRSARSINRKRMSIGYIASPSRDSPAKSSSPVPPGIAPSPLGASDFAQRLRNAASGSAAESRPSKPNGTSDSSSLSPPPMIRTDSSSSTTTLGGSSGGPPTTVMDLSKDLLADIARRERRVWELKEELRREEGDLKELRTRWQRCVTKDLAAAAAAHTGAAHSTSSSISSSISDQQQTSPTLAMAQLRSARRQSQQPTAPLQTQSRNSTDAASAVAGPSSPPASLSDIPQLPPSVTDALRGFSALMPAGLSGHYDALLEGLNVPKVDGVAAVQPQGEKRQSRTLEALHEEEGDEDGAAATGHSARSATKQGQGTTSAAPRRGSSNQSGRSSFSPGVRVIPSNDAVEGSNSKIAAASASSSWTSGWSKRLRDAAAKAEKVIGDAMTVEGLSPGVAGPSAASARPASPSSAPADSGEAKKSPQGTALSPSSSTWVKGKKTATSPTSSSAVEERRPSLSPSSSASSSYFATSNEREKQALASRPEVSWLASFVSGSGTPSPSSAKPSTSASTSTRTTPRSSMLSRPQSSSSSATTATTATTTQRLSDEALLALAEGDGLVHDDVQGGQMGLIDLDAKEDGPQPPAKQEETGQSLNALTSEEGHQVGKHEEEKRLDSWEESLARTEARIGSLESSAGQEEQEEVGQKAASAAEVGSMAEAEDEEARLEQQKGKLEA